jgi:parvulin-like peptidyl-prolyl isomerase
MTRHGSAYATGKSLGILLGILMLMGISTCVQAADRREKIADKQNISKPSIPDVVATVNIHRITREDLAAQCRRHYGKEFLDRLIHKQLIVAECERRGVAVTREDVDAEIARMAKQFGLPVDELLKLIKQERNMTAEQYAAEIWSLLALRKLAGERLTITQEELVKEFETEYGEQISARLIAVGNIEKAKKLQAQAAAKPEDFGNIAKELSEDAPSASAKGMINPIRKHGSYKEIEDAVFNMKDGEVSPVIHAGGQYVILQRIAMLPAKQVKFEQAAPKLTATLRDRKMRTVAPDIFDDMQKNAKVQIVWDDDALREKMPGVAATIDGRPIMLRELDEACIVRYGKEILDGMISRKILEQACQKRNVAVTDADMDAEIARAALQGVKPKPDGSPDVQAWLDLVAKQGVPVDIYRSDVVWPTTALKKLVGDKVQVTDEDLRKGYESNYGPRVRCLAIVLNNQRRAHEVFDLARKNNTSENFAELAAQYSVEPSSQAMRGEVPPFRKYGPQPKLEDEAFSLRPGELSGVIQTGDRFVLLRCEEYTKPVGVDFDSVRNIIYEDLHEKKLRVVMADHFEALQENATVDNFLEGTSHSPEHTKVLPKANVPKLRQVPAK